MAIGVLLTISIVIGLSITVLLVISAIYKKHSTTRVSQQNFSKLLKKTKFPVISFTNNNITLNFIIDTGAEISCIDSRILTNLKYNNVKEMAKCAGLDGAVLDLDRNEMTLKDANGREYFLDFYARDFSDAFDQLNASIGITLCGLIGNDFLQKYKSIIDFEQMIIYLKVNK